MRLVELFVQPPEQDVDEGLGRTLSTGALALATALGSTQSTQRGNSPETEPVAQVQTIDKEEPKIEPKPEPEDPKVQKLVNIVTSKYSVDQELAKEIVKAVKKHADPVFPKAEDLLAIIGIESSFNPNAKSNLKTDPAIGLTQIRPNIWGLNANDLAKDIEKQIAHSSEILQKYKKALGDPQDAVHAYNVGITAFKRGDHNQGYVDKFNSEKQMYTNPQAKRDRSI